MFSTMAEFQSSNVGFNILFFKGSGLINGQLITYGPYGTSFWITILITYHAFWPIYFFIFNFCLVVFEGDFSEPQYLLHISFMLWFKKKISSFLKKKFWVNLQLIYMLSFNSIMYKPNFMFLYFHKIYCFRRIKK